MAKLPLSCYLAKFCVEGVAANIGKETAAVASMLQEKHIFVNPNNTGEINAIHSSFFENAISDFVVLLRVFGKFMTAESDNQRKIFCELNHMNYENLKKARSTFMSIHKTLQFPSKSSADDVNEKLGVCMAKSRSTMVCRHVSKNQYVTLEKGIWVELDKKSVCRGDRVVLADITIVDGNGRSTYGTPLPSSFTLPTVTRVLHADYVSDEKDVESDKDEDPWTMYDSVVAHQTPVVRMTPPKSPPKSPQPPPLPPPKNGVDQTCVLVP